MAGKQQGCTKENNQELERLEAKGMVKKKTPAGENLIPMWETQGGGGSHPCAAVDDGDYAGRRAGDSLARHHNTLPSSLCMVFDKMKVS